MAIRFVFFDLDGTLLPMDQDVFVEHYFKGLAGKMAPHGFDPKGLIKAIWAGTEAMVRNDGSTTNEQAFWKLFCSIYGEDALRWEPVFARFYAGDFQKLASVCGYTPEAARTVELVKARGYTPVLATNPIFPAIATRSRIRWAGMSPEDFVLYTTYENIGYSKPNPAYYTEIVGRLGLDPEDCLMVGNDVGDDMVARKLGMKVFLLTDNLINKDGTDISQFPNGGFAQLRAYIDQLTDLEF